MSGSNRVPDDHPAVQAMARARVVPGRASDEEREAVAAAAGGPWIPHEAVMAGVDAMRVAAASCPACILAHPDGAIVPECPAHARAERDGSDGELVASLKARAPRDQKMR